MFQFFHTFSGFLNLSIERKIGYFHNFVTGGGRAKRRRCEKIEGEAIVGTLLTRSNFGQMPFVAGRLPDEIMKVAENKPNSGNYHPYSLKKSK